MKKNGNRHLLKPYAKGFTKLLRIMKITTFLLLSTMLHAFATGYGQTNVTLNLQNADLPKIFSEIKKKTNLVFLYNDDILPGKKRYDINVNEKPVTVFLDDLFKGSNLAYKFFGENLVVIGTQNFVAAQEQIKGRILAPDGTPLTNVSIKIKDADIGTASDAEGRFTIAADNNATLVISYVGYITQEVKVKAGNDVNIVLQLSNKVLDQVVVVGYGTQKRKNLTSSISSVSSEEIEKSTSIGIEQAIQGRAPGVQVVSNSGQPGSGVQIRIRGTGSILGGNDPLYVIDGFPINNEQTGSDQGGQDRINGLAGINPNDIESVEILKDAAAQAIYGSRGANGVILITTKKGKTGKSSISLATFTGVQKFTNRYKLLNGSQFIDLVKDAARRYPTLNVDTTKLNSGINTDWQDEIFQTGITQSTNISIQGGIDKTRYFVSGSYYKQTGVIIGSGYNRATLRSNIDQIVNKRLKFGINIYASAGVNNRIRNNGSANFQDTYNGNSAYGPNVLSSALVASPLYTPKKADGGYGSDTTGIGTNTQNPVSLAREADLRSNNFRGIANTYLELEIIKGLKYRFNGGYDFRTEEENFYFPPIPNTYGAGRVTVGGYNERNYVVENYLTYNKVFRGSNLTVVGGQSYQYSKFQNFISGISGINLPNIRTLAAGSRDLFARNNIEDYSFSSLYGRVNYEYADKYLLQVSMRSDGSSRFGPNRKYGFFPAVSAAWRISNEGFMKEQKLFTDLRLRASYGKVGNAEVGNYDWRAKLDALRAYLGGTGVLVSNFANLTYSWENVEQLNIGVNATFLKDRFSFVADYYKRTTKDFLFNSRIPQTTGFSTARSNAGDLENKGIELGLVSNNIKTKNFSWITSFNIGINKIKLLRKNPNVDDIQAGPYGYAIRADVSKKIGYYMFQIADKVDPQTGNLVIIDQNKSGSINDSDRVYLGSPFAKHTGGFNNEFSYKNFDLSIFFQWSYGNKIYNSTRAFIEETGRGNNQSTVVLKRWQNPGDITDIPVVSWNGGPNFGYPSSRFLEDGSYLRLKNIQLGYRFSPKAIQKMKIESLKLYVTTQNLLTFTNYKGFDPEVSGTTGRGTGTSIGVGEDFGTYPQAKTFVFGLNVNF